MEIDLSLLAFNYKQLKTLCPNNQVLFMVKADAYGHGMIPIVKFSHFELGIKEFGCASVGEALKLREAIPDGQFEIYVFSDVQIVLKAAKEIYLNKVKYAHTDLFDKLNTKLICLLHCSCFISIPNIQLKERTNFI